VALVCRGLAERKLEHCGLYGTWHWSSPEQFTEYSLAKLIASVLNVPHDHLSPSKESTSTFPVPHDARLNCIALQVMGLGKSTPTKDAILAVTQHSKN
jgi:hypothetical protein